jgi:hypothetical protein
MSRKFLTPLDMSSLQIQNVLAHIIAGAPGSPVEGQYWYDSTAKRLRFRTDAASLTVVTGGGDLAAGSVANSALTTNPLARGNHTGTQTASTISDFDTQVRLSRLDQMAVPTADVSFNSRKLTNVLDPTNPQDAATKNYVDVTVAGLSWKEAVRAATTATGTLATAFANGQTIDGVVLATNDRILLKNQSAAAENGIYIVQASGAPVRATDADSDPELQGAAVMVEEGTVNASTQWIMTTDVAITVGTTGITWAQFGGGATYTAGNGLTLSTNDFNVGAGTGITVAADSVAVDTTLVARWKTGTLGDGSSTSIALTHNLGNRDVICQIYDATSYAVVDCDIVLTNTNTVTVTFSVAPTSNQYRYAIVG